MVISGKDLAQKLKDQMREAVPGYIQKYGRAPMLAVILVGDNPASQSYVRGKAKACEYIGIENQTLVFPSTISQEDLLAEIDKLNNDDTVDGILVQLPLPDHIDKDAVIDAINFEKDVDGFHPTNSANLWREKPCTLPCTPKGIMKLLAAAGVELDGKRAVVVGRSHIVGLPTAKLLLDANATVTIAHSHTKDLAAVTRIAEVLVVAVGHRNLITEDMVTEGAVVIDVGINRNDEGKICGDVDFENVSKKASVITPTPGGVGPMTICCLMENTIECYLNRQK